MAYITLIIFVFCCFIYQSLLQKKDDRIFWLCVAATIFVMAFESYDPTLVNYQIDTPDYIKFYKNLPSSKYGTPAETTFGFEPGLSIVCWLLWFFPKSGFFFILMMRVICMSSIIYGIYRYSRQKELSLLLVVILPGCMLIEMFAMRQALATSMLIWALFIYIEKKKHWRLCSVFFLLFAALSHSTTFLIVPLLAIIYKIPFNRKVFGALVLAAAATCGKFAEKLAMLFSSAFSSASVLERVVSDISDTTELYSQHPLVFILLGLLGCWCVFAYKDGNRTNELFTKIFVSGIIIYCLLGNFPLVDRMTSIFMIIGAIGAIPMLPSADVVYKSFNWWMEIVICVGFILGFYIQNCVHISIFVPYHFLFEQPLLWMYGLQ